MAIIDFSDVGGNLKGNGQSETEKNQRTPSQYWLNVGLVVNGVHLTLPQGIALDKLQAKKIPSSRTQNQVFRNQRIAEKQLWEKLQGLLETMKPGEEVDVPFTCRVRRIEENEEVEESTDNPFDLSGFTF